MRAEKNHAWFFAGNFHQNVFHRKAPDGRVSAKGIRLDVAAIALQFGLQIILQMQHGLRAGRSRAEANLLDDMGEGALAIESASLLRRGRVIGGLWRSGSCRAHERRLRGGPARTVPSGLASRQTCGNEARKHCRAQNYSRK